MGMWRIVKNLLFLFCVILLPLAKSARSQTVHIDMDASQQIIRGFGGIHINAWTGQQINEDLREKAFGNNPGEMGLSIFRMWVDPNRNGWRAELPVAQYATNKGAIVFASPWNPPSNMIEVLRETEYGTDYVLLPEYYDDYVDHLNDFVTYMNNNGVPLYAISVQNEPDWHSWTTWTPQQMLTFVKEYAQNINCRVIAPESFQYRREMTDPLLKDSVANSHFDILGTHLYGTPKSNFNYPLANQKGKEIWMTEHLYGSDSPEENTWALAMEVAEEINLCMEAQMSAFVYWYIRRFYGLIDDAGNITDKGYVMSQFSKFIRPGAYRVSAEINSASNVSSTAYRTDSSLVVVVVNNNNNSVSLDFDIQNNIAGVDSLTKFTTSESKKIVNDGTFAINEGSLSATVDAFSITTFTSDASNGGKFGNKPPVASAGGNREILDSSGSGVSISLAGSESSDPDGEIIKYSWAQNGYQFSTSPDIDINLGIGEYTFILTVTDNDGATDHETIHIKVFNNNSEEIWLEAECTEVGSNWQTLEDNNSSNGKYLIVKPGIQALNSPSSNADDLLVYHFSVEESGSYKIWGRVLAPTANDDSFWIKMDGGNWIMWNNIAGGSTWQWDDVHNQSESNPMNYALDPGGHTLTVCFREDGAAIDKFYLTNTGQEPTGKGSDASNCNASSSSDTDNSSGLIKTYPNPAKHDLFVESQKPFKILLIYNAQGKVVWQKTYSVFKYADNVPLNFENGIYLLQISDGKNSSVKKFIIEK